MQKSAEFVKKTIIFSVIIYFTVTNFILAEPFQRLKAPYRVLFSNDCTNIWSCKSPYNPNRATIFTEDMLTASVDETVEAGCDVHMLQPGITFVPLWKSKVYPADEHRKWWSKTFKGKMHPYIEYVANGGDMVEVFVKHCRKRKIAPFISLRMNDWHMMEYINFPEGSKIRAGWGSAMMDRWRREHPQYWLSKPEKRTALGQNPLETIKRVGLSVRNEHILNWAEPQVRERVFSFVKEICENYDIDGLELDFMRQFFLFRLDETTSQQRQKIMLEFIGRVRSLLNRTAKKGQHRWLCVRMPAIIAGHDARGMDVVKMVEAGVDMINLSNNYYTVQQSDLEQVCKLVPQAAVYLELCHTTRVGPIKNMKGLGEKFSYRRTTSQQYETAAHLVYSRGGQGISLFNFAYYREYSSPQRGPYNEPPFDVIKDLSNPKALSKKPQHYYLCPGWSSHVSNVTKVPEHVSYMLPRTLRQGKTTKLILDMAPPVEGWKGTGKLRIQSDTAFEDSQIDASINGVKLLPSCDVSEPYPNPYSPMLGTTETLRAWIVPSEILRNGQNTIELTLTEGADINLEFVDLAVE